MKENKILWLSDIALVIFIVIVLSAVAVINIIRGNAPHPGRFPIVAIGFVFFVIAKASVFKKGNLFSIGTKDMSTMMANLYRLGY
jgi:hypothetical protein